jgi:hypothetical protein
MMAIEDRFQDVTKGRVSLTIENLGESNVSIEVWDNGIGLDADHFGAFCEIDTEFKRAKGGKGVGRLFWLDAFSDIEVDSRYRSDTGEIRARSFKFVLDDPEQIQFFDSKESWPADETGTRVCLRRLRTSAYVQNFPKQAAMVQNHTASEFVAAFLSGRSPILSLSVKTKRGRELVAEYPRDIHDMVFKELEGIDDVSIEGSGTFKVRVFLCYPQASRGMGFRHGVHLLGNGRTVETRNVDDLLGLRALSFETETDLRLHVVVESPYLDERTVESRTTFTIPENERAEITRQVILVIREGVLSEQFEAWDKTRRVDFYTFLQDQPIFAFADPDEIFEKVLSGSDASPEDFVRTLSVERMRREKERELKLSGLVKRLVSGGELPINFSTLVSEAADKIKTNERSSLAHHAARRKVVLDLLDRLIRRVREIDEDAPERYHLEETLHSLLVPMRIRGDDLGSIERAAHDLWIVDERLTYTAGFSSDLPLRKMIKDSNSDDRPDVLIWNTGFGLGPIESPYGDEDVDDTKPLSRVFIVELKMPGRQNYGVDESIERQLTKYVREINGGMIEGFGRRRIRVTNDCQFYCFVVADFEGRLLEQELWTWDEIDGGRARRKPLPQIRTVIDCVTWGDVLRDARERNRALITMAGLSLRADTAFGKS